MDERLGGPPPAPAGAAVSGVDGLVVEVVHPRSGILLVVVRGELVERTAARAEHLLARALPAEPHDPRHRVAVDLSGVSAVTAPGLDVLLRLQDRIDAAGGHLELLAPSAPVILLLHEAVSG